MANNPLNVTWAYEIGNNLQQQAFNNQQSAAKNQALVQSVTLDNQAKQLAIDNQTAMNKAYQSLQGRPNNAEKLKQDVAASKQDYEQYTGMSDKLRQMAKNTPNFVAAQQLEAQALKYDAQAAAIKVKNLDAVQKHLSAQAGYAQGMLQANSQEGYDFMLNQMRQNNEHLPDGLSGNWTQDKPKIEAVAHQIDKTQNVVAMQKAQFTEKHQQDTEARLNKGLDEKINHDRAAEAIARQNTANKPTPEDKQRKNMESMSKAHVHAHDVYLAEHNKLKAAYDKAVKGSDQATADLIAKQMHELTDNFHKTNTEIYNAYGVTPPASEQPKPTNDSSNFWNK